jgi:WD40 repeat protein
VGLHAAPVRARDRQGALAVAVSEDVLAPPRIPYRGIQPFRYVDHAIFLAREEETEDLLDLVTIYRGVLVYGASGDGKSSLINAGLLPAVGRRRLRPERVRVQPRHGEEIVVERIEMTEDEGEHLPSMLAPEGDDAARIVMSVQAFEDRVREVCASERPLLIFDQFEEIITLFEQQQDAVGVQRDVVEMLVRLLHEPLAVKLLFVFREDYLGKVKHLLAAAPELIDQALRLEPLSMDVLPTIIRGPFDRHPGHFARELDPELAERVCNALAQRFASADLSLSEVETVALRLWQSDDPQTLLDTRGVQGILEDYLGEALDAFSSDLRAAAIALLAQMVTSAGTRNVSTAEDLIQRAREENPDLPPELLAEALDRLERESRLIRREHRRDIYLYEITSEFLVPWISQRREELHRQQERARERRRLRILSSIAGGLLIIGAVIAVIAVWALDQRAEAQRQRKIGASRELAARATSLLGVDPGLSVGLGLEALKRWDTEQAENALRQATFTARGTAAWPAHDGWLSSIAPSRDGRYAATGGHDGTVRVWRLDRGRVVSTIRAHHGQAFDTSFSPSGRLLASGGADGVVAVVDADGRHRHVLLRLGADTYVTSVDFSADGRRLAVAATDGKVRLLAVNRRGRDITLSGHQGAVYAVRFNRDATKVVSASDDRTARIWDVASHRSTSLPHVAAVTSASFDPNGRRLATAGADGKVRIWDVSGRGPLKILGADTQPLSSVRYSHDGKRLVTAGDDGVVRVWDVRSGAAVDALKGHRGMALRAEFVPGSDVILSTGEDGTLRRWAPVPTTVIHGDLTGVSFSADGRYVAGGGSDGVVHVWDRTTGSRSELRGHAASSFAQFWTGGARIISASWDGSVRVWTRHGGRWRSYRVPVATTWQKWAAALDPTGRRIAIGGAQPRLILQRLRGGGRIVMRGHDNRVLDVAFSPDGHHLLSASDDGTARIWNTADGKLEQVFSGHSGGVKSAAYSPDGRRVVTAGADGTVRVWRVGDGRSVVMHGHAGPVRSVEFTREGAQVVSAGQDGTVRVWNADGGETLVVLQSHQGPASGVDATPDGRSVVSAGADGIVRVTACEVCGPLPALLRLARTRAGRQLGATERQRFLAGDG